MVISPDVDVYRGTFRGGKDKYNSLLLIERELNHVPWWYLSQCTHRYYRSELAISWK